MTEGHELERITWLKRVGVDNTNETDMVAVTARTYDEVMLGLGVPDSYFTPDMKVLSVGEGLSNFVDRLSIEKGIEAIGIDPVYEVGESLFQTDPEEVKKVLEKFYQKRVNLQTFGVRKLPDLDPARLMPMSVYEMAFPDDYFDLVTSFRVVEHIDLALALQELVRVTQPEGEIRMGGVVTHVLGDLRREFNAEVLSLYERGNFSVPQSINRPTKLLLDSVLHNLRTVFRKDFAEEVILTEDQFKTIPFEQIREKQVIVADERPQRGNMQGALEWLNADPSLTAYMVLDSIPRGYNLREYGVYFGGQLIIRQDDKWPEVKPFNLDNLADMEYIFNILSDTKNIPEHKREVEKFPDIRRVFRLNPELKQNPDQWPYRYYELTSLES